MSILKAGTPAPSLLGPQREDTELHALAEHVWGPGSKRQQGAFKSSRHSSERGREFLESTGPFQRSPACHPATVCRTQSGPLS